MNAIRRTRSSVAWSLLAAVLLLLAGCKAPWSSDWRFSDVFDLDKNIPWKDDGPKKGTKGTPSRLVGTWTDAVLQQSGRVPQRGFGGRLLFYRKEDNKPILVDGQLVVYAFDETRREPTDNRPTRRYVFPPEQVALHMSESEIGPSYSFWLPWDEVGGPKTEVSLIARFEPKRGGVVVSEQTRHVLPGTLSPDALPTDNRPPKFPEGVPVRPAPPSLSAGSAGANRIDNQVQLAGYEAPIANAAAPAIDGATSAAATAEPAPRRMTTTSISLPENFRLRGSTATVHGAVGTGYGEPIRQELPPAAASQGATNAAKLPAPTPPAGQPPARQPSAAHPFFSSQPQWIDASVGPAPGGPQHFPTPAAPTLAAPTNVGHADVPIRADVSTTVSYSPPAESARWGAIPPPSFGFAPLSPQAPSPPAFR